FYSSSRYLARRSRHSFPTRRSSDLIVPKGKRRISEWAKTFNFDWPEQGEVTTRLRDILEHEVDEKYYLDEDKTAKLVAQLEGIRSEEHTSELQSRFDLVCRLLLETK